MPLSMLGKGGRGCIIRISGSDKVKRHLESLGFIVGADVSVVSEFGGNIIVNVKDTRVAVDRAMACRIFV